MISCQWTTWLAETLGSQVRKLKAQRPPDQPVIGVAPSTLRSLLRTASGLLRLPATIQSIDVYALRHSGASADRLEKKRPLVEVKRRGRWRSDSSLRRYEKGGFAAVQLSKCSAALRTFARTCEQRLLEVLAGSSAPCAPPSRDRW